MGLKQQTGEELRFMYSNILVWFEGYKAIYFRFYQANHEYQNTWGKNY